MPLTMAVNPSVLGSLFGVGVVFIRVHVNAAALSHISAMTSPGTAIPLYKKAQCSSIDFLFSSVSQTLLSKHSTLCFTQHYLP